MYRVLETNTVYIIKSMNDAFKPIINQVKILFTVRAVARVLDRGEGTKRK